MTKTQLCVNSLIVIGVAFFVSGCSPQAKPDVEAVPQPVKVVEVKSSMPEPLRQFPARVEASKTANVATKVGAKVTKVYIETGDRVKAGTVLFELDTTDFQLNLEQAQANFELAKVSFERMATSRERNVATQSQYDEAKASFDSASVALRQAENQLSDTKIYAPFDSIVTEVSVETYDFVSATQNLAVVQDTDNVDVVFQVPSDIVAHLSEETRNEILKVRFDSFPEQSYSARIREFRADSDRTTGSFDATLTLKLPEVEGNILPGMNATVFLNMHLTGEVPQLTVPVHTVFKQGSQQATWVVTEGKVNAVPVKTGDMIGDQLIVTEGLNEGDIVVAAGVSKLIEGQDVAVWTGE